MNTVNNNNPFVETAYTVLPLAWKKSFCDWQQQYEAVTPFGRYQVKRIREGCEAGKPWQHWEWDYCFCEYYDEGSSQCDNARAGMESAQSHWDGRILPCLKEHTTED